MEYIITKATRNNLILSSSYLILNYIFLGFSFLLKDVRELDAIENAIVNVLFIVSFGYIYFIIKDYFKHFKFKALELVTLTILIAEVGIQIITLINSINPIIPNFLSKLFGVIAVISIVVWIILILRLKSVEISAFSSLRKLAFGKIAAFVLGFIISLVVMFGYFNDFYNTMYFAVAIPYIFSIEFALKLKIKE